MTHEILYRKVGVHKLGHFISPNILLDTDFIFPKRSELSWFKVSPTVDTPHRGIGYLQNIKDKPAVVTRYIYAQPIGNFKTKESAITKVIRSQQKMHTDMLFIKINARKLKVSADRLLINTYGSLSAVHTYRPAPTMVYDRWRNGFNTLVDNINNTNQESRRHIYVTIDLPSNIPVKEKFDMCLQKKPKQILDHFPTAKHLTLLEIWKFLTPDLIKDSMLYKLKRSELANITLMFTYNNKVTLLNLNTLLSTVKEYEGKTNIQEQSASVMRKMFLIYLMKIKSEASKSFLEIEKNSSSLTVDSVIAIDDTEMETIDPDVILDEEFDEDLVGPNYDDLSDDMLDANKTNTLVDIVDEDIESISDLDKGISGKEKLKKQTKVLKDAGSLTKRDVEIIEESLENQSKSANPYGDSKQTLQEMLIVTDKDMEIPEKLQEIPDINILEDKDVLQDPIKAMDQHYLKNIYKKDILSSIYAIQSNDVVIRNHEIETSKDILGGIEIHTIELKPLSGKPSKITFRLPAMEEDGTFKLSGNKYTLRKQRGDIPIRKIASNKVALSSYYGKSFVTRSDFKKDQIGYWFRKKLIEVAEGNPKISNLVFMPVKLMDTKVPPLYASIAEYIKMFKLGNIKYSFDYHNRADIIGDGVKVKQKWEMTEPRGTTVVGYDSSKSKFILMKMDGSLGYMSKGTFTGMPSLNEQLGIDESSKPVENISIKVFKQKLPVGLLLAYYLGFSKLMKILKTKHKIIERGKRYTIADDEYVITFKDYKVILKRDDGVSSLIIGGFRGLNKELKSIEMTLLDKKESFPVLFNAINLPTLYVNEIRLMEDMFIDPITKSVLTNLELPETFKGLLIKSAKMLLDNDYVNPNDSSGMLIKGHERIAGMIYTETINSLREFENKNTFSKSKITMDPYGIWKKINNDSTVMLVDDLNPIAALKQSEDLTYMGEGGINKDAISQDKRVYHPSEVGVISEAVKDSGDVGVSAYMSANPKIGNVRGKVKDNKGKMNPSNYFSTSAMLSASGDMDDGKRLNFVQIQNGHVIPINNMRVPAVRTGYEAVLPYRLDESYCYMAEEDGVVDGVVNNKHIKITFKSGKTKTVKLGSWTTKEESGVSYKHTLITDLRKGDKFKKGNSVSYDDAFFEPDIFDPKRVIFKTGTTMRMALMETSNTYEDAATISSKVSKKLGTNIIKSKSFILKIDDNILNMIKIGDKVEPTDLLFSIASDNLVDENGKFDKESLAVLQNIKNKSPKAKMRGKIQNIKIFYNSELDDLSKTLQELAIESDKRLDDKFTGKVNSSYSIKGKPLNPGTVEVKVYIEDNIIANIADKLVMSLQLKCTISDVYTHEMKTEDGTEIEGTFSTKSIANRIVASTTINATTTTVLNKLRDNAVDMYFN